MTQFTALNEAIRAGDFKRSSQLILKYLWKRLGSKVYLYPTTEKFIPAGGRVMSGIRYFLNGNQSVRLNWLSDGKINASSGLVSMDFWDGSKNPQPYPSHHVKFKEEQSLAKVLPMVVDFVSGKIDRSTDGIYVNEAVETPTMSLSFDFTDVKTINEATFTSGEISKTISNTIHALEQGMSPSDQYKAGGLKKFGPRWNKIIDYIKVEYPEVFSKSGVKLIVNKDKVGSINTAKVLQAVAGGDDAVAFTTSAGSREEKVVDGVSDKDVERMTYEEQLEALKTGMKLLMSNATNALFLGGRGGCLKTDQTLNVIIGGNHREATIGDVLSIVTERENIDSLVLNHFYDIKDLRIEVETRSGYVPATHFVAKPGLLTKVTFSDGQEFECSDRHYFNTENGSYQARHLRSSDYVLTKEGRLRVAKVVVSDKMETFYDLSVASDDQLYLTANGFEHHNTGKTQTVEDMLSAAGKEDGAGYTKITGSATPAGIYRLLFQNRKNILLFDDSDSALNDQDGRNLFKAASDTKPKRKISWQKGGKNYIDPDDYNWDEEGEQDELPRSFDFEGKIIFISNLPLNKLDPDGALRTRGYVLNVDPTNEEIYEFMSKIADKIKLDVDYKLDKNARLEVIEILKTRKIAEKSANLRSLVRGLNTRAGIELSGGSASEWQKFVKMFA